MYEVEAEKSEQNPELATQKEECCDRKTFTHPYVLDLRWKDVEFLQRWKEEEDMKANTEAFNNQAFFYSVELTLALDYINVKHFYDVCEQCIQINGDEAILVVLTTEEQRLLKILIDLPPECENYSCPTVESMIWQLGNAIRQITDNANKGPLSEEKLLKHLIVSMTEENEHKRISLRCLMGNCNYFHILQRILRTDESLKHEIEECINNYENSDGFIRIKSSELMHKKEELINIIGDNTFSFILFELASGSSLFEATKFMSEHHYNLIRDYFLTVVNTEVDEKTL